MKRLRAYFELRDVQRRKKYSPYLLLYEKGSVANQISTSTGSYKFFYFYILYVKTMVRRSIRGIKKLRRRRLVSSLNERLFQVNSSVTLVSTAFCGRDIDRTGSSYKGLDMSVALVMKGTKAGWETRLEDLDARDVQWLYCPSESIWF